MDLLHLLLEHADVASLVITIGLVIWAFRFNKIITELKHLLIGIDGKNGLRSRIEQLEGRVTSHGKEIEGHENKLTAISTKMDS